MELLLQEVVPVPSSPRDVFYFAIVNHVLFVVYTINKLCVQKL